MTAIISKNVLLPRKVIFELLSNSLKYFPIIKRKYLEYIFYSNYLKEIEQNN